MVRLPTCGAEVPYRMWRTIRAHGVSPEIPEILVQGPQYMKSTLVQLQHLWSLLRAPARRILLCEGICYH